jgi:hypothetical protein
MRCLDPSHRRFVSSFFDSHLRRNSCEHHARRGDAAHDPGSPRCTGSGDKSMRSKSSCCISDELAYGFSVEQMNIGLLLALFFKNQLQT